VEKKIVGISLYILAEIVEMRPSAETLKNERAKIF
jgi:hypothetical protein